MQSNNKEKIIGIVAEFNPLHNGHKILIEKAKSLSDKIIIALSGNITQRGEFACLEKHIRATHAVKLGASMVVEIPPIFIMSSANLYADGAIRTLKNSGANTILFGSEEGNIDKLEELASNYENKSFQNLIKRYVKMGNSYPKAQQLACDEKYPELSDLLHHPNNLLSLEYIKACKKYEMDYINIQRPCNYHDENSLGDIPSASAIRKELNNDNIKKIKASIPDCVYNDLKINFNKNVYYPILREKILNTSTIVYENMYDATEGIENRIFNAAKESLTLNQLIDAVKTKRYTQTKIQRVLMHILFQVTNDQAKQLIKKPLFYNVLAINNNYTYLLSNKLLTSKYKDYLQKNMINSLDFILISKIDTMYAIINNNEYVYKNLTIV